MGRLYDYLTSALGPAPAGAILKAGDVEGGNRLTEAVNGPYGAPIRAAHASPEVGIVYGGYPYGDQLNFTNALGIHLPPEDLRDGRAGKLGNTISMYPDLPDGMHAILLRSKPGVPSELLGYDTNAADWPPSRQRPFTAAHESAHFLLPSAGEFLPDAASLNLSPAGALKLYEDRGYRKPFAIPAAENLSDSLRTMLGRYSKGALNYRPYTERGKVEPQMRFEYNYNDLPATESREIVENFRRQREQNERDRANYDKMVNDARKRKGRK